MRQLYVEAGGPTGAWERVALGAVLALLSMPARAQGPRDPAPGSAAMSAVPLHNGRNPVDVLGGGATGVIEVADRENFNAHGSHVAFFEVRAHTEPGHAESPVEWQVVPFLGAGQDSALFNNFLQTIEGADCTLRDIRVLRPRAGGTVQVVIAERELQRSYADSEAVRFRFFELRANREGVAGYPAYYFVHTRTISARRSYCDVDDAFDRELHLGREGLVTWRGPA